TQRFSLYEIRLLLAARRRNPLHPQIQRQRRVLLGIVRHGPPHQTHTRPLALAQREQVLQIPRCQRRERLVALHKRSLQRRHNRRLVRRLLRTLRQRSLGLPVHRAACPELRLRHVIHHTRIRPHIRNRFVAVVRRRHLVGRLQDVLLHSRITLLHLCHRPY